MLIWCSFLSCSILRDNSVLWLSALCRPPTARNISCLWILSNYNLCRTEKWDTCHISLNHKGRLYHAYSPTFVAWLNYHCSTSQLCPHLWGLLVINDYVNELIDLNSNTAGSYINSTCHLIMTNRWQQTEACFNTEKLFGINPFWTNQFKGQTL